MNLSKEIWTYYYQVKQSHYGKIALLQSFRNSYENHQGGMQSALKWRNTRARAPVSSL